MANALADESSPYLRQHADNPVDWLPWGSSAFERARERDLPLFLSIGYAACHWCHVMERESFADPRVATLMNEHFVCVKVDREERPDIDGVYMQAVALMTGLGGWPLSVFLTPVGTPFFGGTYWPPQPRQGMPSFTQVLTGVVELWHTRREQALAGGAQLVAHLRSLAAREPSSTSLDRAPLRRALAALRERYDPVDGGFGGAPKFPPHCTLELLLRSGELDMSLATLRAMARGGICDQVGGGFARYAVDATWTVPHFEKMLYDNALLARSYLHAWQLSGDELLLRTCRETLDFCLRELRSPEGGFYCSLDADSDGAEGAYYVWQFDELRELLGARAQAAIAYFGASERGNFEGTNILRATGQEPPDRAEIREILLAARERRIRPALDDKQLTSWNALMIAALADAGAVLAEQRYLAAATRAAELVWQRMRDADGRLLRSFAAGRATVAGFLEDYAFMLESLLTLYEASFDERFFVWARELGDALIERFADVEHGGFFASGRDGEQLVVPRKEAEDHPIPAGASSAALGLLRLAALTGEQRYKEHALAAIRLSIEAAPRFPESFAYLLCALDFHLADVRELALVGDELHVFDRVVREAFRPHIVLAGARDGSESSVPLLQGRRAATGGRTAAYVCERFACRAPIEDPAALAAALRAATA